MNRLFLLPTNESLDVLKSIMAASPILIDWDRVAVEIGSSESDIVPADPDVQYRALTNQAEVWYESATGHSSWLLSLLPSPEMAERHDKVGDAWGRELFLPFMNLSVDPLLRRNRRAFMNSVSTRLMEYPVMLTFQNEVVVHDKSVVPSQQDFYEDYVSRSKIMQLPRFEDYQL